MKKTVKRIFAMLLVVSLMSTSVFAAVKPDVTKDEFIDLLSGGTYEYEGRNIRIPDAFQPANAFRYVSPDQMDQLETYLTNLEAFKINPDKYGTEVTVYNNYIKDFVRIDRDAHNTKLYVDAVVAMTEFLCFRAADRTADPDAAADKAAGYLFDALQLLKQSLVPKDFVKENPMKVTFQFDKDDFNGVDFNKPPLGMYTENIINDFNDAYKSETVKLGDVKIGDLELPTELAIATVKAFFKEWINEEFKTELSEIDKTFDEFFAESALGAGHDSESYVKYLIDKVMEYVEKLLNNPPEQMIHDFLEEMLDTESPFTKSLLDSMWKSEKDKYIDKFYDFIYGDQGKLDYPLLDGSEWKAVVDIDGNTNEELVTKGFKTTFDNAILNTLQEIFKDPDGSGNYSLIGVMNILRDWGYLVLDPADLDAEGNGTKYSSIDLEESPIVKIAVETIDFIAQIDGGSYDTAAVILNILMGNILFDIADRTKGTPIYPNQVLELFVEEEKEITFSFNKDSIPNPDWITYPRDVISYAHYFDYSTSAYFDVTTSSADPIMITIKAGDDAATDTLKLYRYVERAYDTDTGITLYGMDLNEDIYRLMFEFTVRIFEPRHVFYDANWPGAGAGTGDVPEDLNKYKPDEKAEVLPATLTQDGWAFLGWSEEDDATDPTYLVENGAVTPNELTMPDSDVTLYGVWVELETIDAVDKTAESPTYTPDETMEYTISFTLPSDLTGYAAVSVKDSFPADLTYNSTVSATVDGADITVTADVASGTVSYVIDAADLVEGAVVKIAILFDIDEDAEDDIVNDVSVFVTPVNGEKKSVADATDSEKIELFVAPTTYTVTYNGNGNTGGTAPVDVNSPYSAGDDVTVLDKGDLVKTGHTFLGWATTADATSADPSYSPSAKFAIAADITLYAVWKADVVADTYTVTYDANWPLGAAGTGTVPTDATVYEEGDSVTVLPATLEKDGWAFLGWATTDDAATPIYNVVGTVVSPDVFIMGDANVTLYGVWADLSFGFAITKTAAQIEYTPGGTVSYTVSFVLPDSLVGYSSIRVEDVMPSELTYTDLISATVGSDDIKADVVVDETVSGFVSFIMAAADLTAGETVDLVIEFDIDGAATGSIYNTVNLFVTPLNGAERTASDASYEERIIEEGMFMVVYDANAPTDGVYSGVLPIDPIDYVHDDDVTVQAGGLKKANWAFLGWSEDKDASLPTYFVNNGVVTPASFTIDEDVHTNPITLYGIWAAPAAIDAVEKATATTNYTPGGDVQFTISVDLPADLLGYGSIRIEDSVPSDLAYTELVTATIDGTDVKAKVDIDTAVSGFVSFEIDAADLVADKTVVLVVKFDVAAGATANITNNVNVFVTPLNGDEKLVADKADAATIYPPGVVVVSLTYDANGATSGVVPDTAQNYPINTAVTVLGNTGVPALAKTDHTFIGWATSVADATIGTLAHSVSSSNVVSPATITLDKDTTLYAVWQSNTIEPTPTPTPGGGHYGGFGGRPITVVPSPTPAKPTEMTPDHIAYVQGDQLGMFNQQSPVTRAEVVAMFTRLIIRQMDKETDFYQKFSDIKEDDWFANLVLLGTIYNIINGYEDGTFRPNEYITRAEFSTIASRFIADPIETTHYFPDVEGHWASKYISYVFGKGWVVGYEDGTFGPELQLTRAEAVTVINRMNGRVADRAFIDANIGSMKTYPDLPKDHWAYYDIIEASNSHEHEYVDMVEKWIGLM